MENFIAQIALYVGPAIAGVFVSVVIPVSIKKFVCKVLRKKIEEESPDTKLKVIEKELAVIKREILEMRGKTK